MKRANSFCTNFGKRFKGFFSKCAAFFRKRFSKRFVKRTTFQLALSAVFTALTLVATIVISIPIPATGGYVNVGDTMIFLSGALFGPFVGGISGGLGSMAADLILGYSFYAPFTFLIKGLEGVLCGLLGYFVANKFKKHVFRYGFQFVSFVLSGLFMCAGYFFVEFGYYDIGGALGGLTGNLIQAFSSVALASALLFFCKLGDRVVRKSFPNKPNVNRSGFDALKNPEKTDIFEISVGSEDAPRASETDGSETSVGSAATNASKPNDFEPCGTHDEAQSNPASPSNSDESDLRF